MSTMLITTWIVAGLTLYIGIGTFVFIRTLTTNQAKRLAFNSQPHWMLKVGIVILSVLAWWLLLIPRKGN